MEKAPKRLREIPQKRDLFSKHYLNEDGTYTAEISAGVIHYKDENENYQDISVELFDEDDFDQVDFPVTKEKKASFKARKEVMQGLKEKAKGGKVSREDSDFHGLKVPFDATIPKKFKKGYSIGKGSSRLTFKPEGANAITGQKIAPNVIKYAGAWAKTDVVLELRESGIKETIILQDEAAPNIFSFELTGPLQDDFTAGDLRMEPAWLVDAAGERRDVQTKIRKQGAKTFVDLLADVYGLVFPVEIDPTVTLYNSNIAIDMEMTPGANVNNPELVVSSAGNGWRKSAIKFTLPSYIGEVTAATLTLKATGNGNSTEVLVAAEYLTKDWNTTQYQDSSGVWRNYDGSRYSKPPSVFMSQKAATNTIQGATWEFDVKAGLNYFIQNNVNYGFVLRAPESDNGIGYQYGLIYFGSGENSYSPYLPTMTITYTSAPGGPTVTAPNGGEVWDKTHTITWTAATDPDTAQSSLRYQIQLSTNGGGTWKDIVALTTAGVTSYSYNFTSEPETTQAKVRIRAYDGANYGPWDESNAAFTIRHNQAPNSPGNTQPAGTSTAPAIVQTLAPGLSWVFSDPDAGNTQSAYQVLVYDMGNVLKHDSGKVIGSPGTSKSHLIPAGILAWKTKYYWQVRTWDQADAVSPYSTAQYFLTNQGPTATITYPPATGGVGDLYHNTLQPTITWTYSDPDGDAQSAVQILIKDGAATVFDSGEIVTTGGSYQVPGTANLSYDKTYSVQMRAKDVNGTWGSYSGLKLFHLNRFPGDPVNVFPNGSNVNPTIIQDNLTPRITWDFVDPDPTDYADAFRLQILDAVSGSVVHDSGFVQSTNTYYDVPAGVLISGKKYYLKLAVRDQHTGWNNNIINNSTDAVTSETTLYYFYTNAKPNTPLNPSPAGGSAASPATIFNDLTPTLSWQFADPNSGDSQKAFQVRLYNEFGTLLHDSGEVVSPAGSYEIPAANRLFYSDKYQWEVRVKDQYDAWSNYTSRAWFILKVGTPTGITAMADNFGAKIIVDWADSMAEGLQGYNVYRATAAGGPYTKINDRLLTQSLYNDSQVSTGVTYFYKVEAYVNATEISPLSAAVSAVAVFSAWYIGDFKFTGPTAFSGKRARVRSSRVVLGKSKKVVQDRGFLGENLSLDIFLGRDEYSTGKQKFDQLMAELSKTQALSVRDPFGQVWKVSPGDVDYDIVPGAGELTYKVRIPLEEVN